MSVRRLKPRLKVVEDCPQPETPFKPVEYGAAPWSHSQHSPNADAGSAHRRARNLMRLIIHYFAPTPQQRLIIGTFLIGCMWGAMCAIGLMAAWGIHP